jgi:hypothetical protein
MSTVIMRERERKKNKQKTNQTRHMKEERERSNTEKNRVKKILNISVSLTCATGCEEAVLLECGMFSFRKRKWGKPYCWNVF